MRGSEKGTERAPSEQGGCPGEARTGAGHSPHATRAKPRGNPGEARKGAGHRPHATRAKPGRGPGTARTHPGRSPGAPRATPGRGPGTARTQPGRSPEGGRAQPARNPAPARARRPEISERLALSLVDFETHEVAWGFIHFDWLVKPVREVEEATFEI